MTRKFIDVLLLFSVLFSLSSAQDTPRLFDVRKLLKETLDMMRTVPPPPAYVTPIQSLIPGVPPPGGRQPLSIAQNSPPYYQHLQSQPLPVAPMQQQQQVAQPTFISSYGGQIQPASYGPQPPQVYAQPQVAPTVSQQSYVPGIPEMPSSLSRMFAAPTEKDMERLFQLPADILTKLATDARYIDPEPDHVPKSSSSGSSSSSNSSSFSGFSFSVEDTSKAKKGENAATAVPEVSSANSTSANKTAVAQKPYYLYRDGPDGRATPWVLVVPQPNGAPSEFIPYNQITEITKILDIAKNNQSNNVSVPVSPPVAPAEKASEIVKTQQNETQKSAVRNENISAFVQEADVPSTTTTVAPTETTTTMRTTTIQTQETIAPQNTQAHEIVLNGKKYKLVNEEQKPITSTTTTSVPPIQVLSANILQQPSSYPTFEELARQQNNWQIPVSKPQQFTLNGQTYIFSPASSPSFIPQQPQTSVVSNLSPQQQAILSAYSAQNPSQLYSMNGQTFAAPTYSTDSVWQPLAAAVPQPAIPPATTNELFQQAPLIMRNQDEFSEEYAQPQQSPPVATLPPQTAPHFIPSDAIVITTTNAPETTVAVTKSEKISTSKRRYTIEELAEYFRFKNMDFNEIAGFLNVSKKPEKFERNIKSANKPHKQVKIVMEERKTTPFVTDTYDIEVYTTKKPKKYTDVRRKEHKRLSKLHMVSSEESLPTKPVTVLKMKKPEQKPRMKITAQHCRNIRSFARQFGTLDIESFAKAHCSYIANYYPDLKCSNVKEYVKICKSYYHMRRLYS